MNLNNLSEQEKHLIHRFDPFQMTEYILNKELRGLEKISIESVRNQSALPAEVLNVLLIYFYQEYSDQVYNRNDLKKLYNLWAVQGVRSFEDALDMSERDIHTDLGYK